MVAKLVQTSASELSPDRSASVSTAEALQEDDRTRSASSSAVSRQDMSAEHCVAIKRPMSIRNRAEDGMKAHQGPHNGLIIVLTLSFLCFLINTATNSGVHLARATGECNATTFDKKLIGCFGLTYLSCLSVQHSKRDVHQNSSFEMSQKVTDTGYRLFYQSLRSRTQRPSINLRRLTSVADTRIYLKA